MLRGRRWWAVAAALGMGSAGCANGPSAAEEAQRLEAIQKEGAALTRAADELEDRMLADQANLLLWQELARRHQYVSAVVTRTQLEHFSSMVKMMEHQEEKARKLKRRHVAELELELGERPALSQASAPGASRARN